MKKNICILLTTVFIITILFSSGVSNSQEKKPVSDTLLRSFAVYQVKPFGRPLFTIHSGLGPFSSESRGKEIEAKIRDLAMNPLFLKEKLHIVESYGNLRVMYEEENITAVTVKDSILENKSRISIAKYRLTQISNAVSQYREENKNGNILRGILFSVVILILLILLFFIVNRLYRYTKKKINEWEANEKNLLSLKGYEFLNKRRQGLLLHFLNKTLRALLFILLFLIGLLVMFYLLPWTKPFTLSILGIILQPVKLGGAFILKVIPDLLIIIVIVTITFYINRFFSFLRREIENKSLRIPGFYPEWALPTFNIIRVLIWVFALIVLWPYIPGSDSKIFQGVSVFFGLILSFTSASLLSNIMSGFSLTYTRAFQIGDRIKIGDITGDVIEKSMLVTKLLTVKNEEVTIPNSKIMSSEVINYTTQAKDRGLIIYTSVTIGYDAPWRKIHELLINAALSTDGIIHEPVPFVLQTSLDDFYISYQINAYTRDPQRLALSYSLLHQNIQDKFNEAGMEIMSPHYRSVRDGNVIAIPEENRDKGYEPPAFRVKSHE